MIFTLQAFILTQKIGQLELLSYCQAVTVNSVGSVCKYVLTNWLFPKEAL